MLLLTIMILFSWYEGACQGMRERGKATSPSITNGERLLAQLVPLESMFGHPTNLQKNSFTTSEVIL
jgi:hypothetical protein